MNESFDAYRYIGYLRARWRWIACSAALAVVLAAAASLAMTPQYTATARVVIEPPAGRGPARRHGGQPDLSGIAQDLRTLRRQRQPVPEGGAAIRPAREARSNRSSGACCRCSWCATRASWKSRRPCRTRRRRRRWPNSWRKPRWRSNRASVAEGDQDLLRGIEQQARDLRARLQETDANWAKAVAGEPLVSLQASVEQAADQRSKMEEQAQSAELEIADLADRVKTAADAGGAAQAGKQRARAAGGDSQADAGAGPADRRTRETAGHAAGASRPVGRGAQGGAGVAGGDGGAPAGCARRVRLPRRAPEDSSIRESCRSGLRRPTCRSTLQRRCWRAWCCRFFI